MRSRLATLVRGSSRPDTVLRSRPAHLRVTVVAAVAPAARPQPHPPPPPGAPTRHSTSPSLTQASISEALEVAVDEHLADEERHDAAERQERPERHRGLAALRRALAGDDERPDEHAGDERHEDRRRDRAAEVEAEH